jgi:hypothetical protein
MRADGQTNRRTDITKLIAIFRNFANAPKNLCISVLTFAVPVNYDAILSESLVEALFTYTICLVNHTIGSAYSYNLLVCETLKQKRMRRRQNCALISLIYYSSNRVSVLTIIYFSLFRIRKSEVTALKRWSGQLMLSAFPGGRKFKGF